MNSQDMILGLMRAQGKADALDLRGRAGGMTDTAIIAERQKAPDWSQERDYSDWPAGAPVRDQGRTFGLIIPHNAAHQPPDVRPADLPALWSPKHTTDPKLAEPYLPPNGTSGLWSVDECCTENGHVYRNSYDKNEFSPSAMPDRWTDLGAVEDVQA